MNIYFSPALNNCSVQQVRPSFTCVLWSVVVWQTRKFCSIISPKGVEFLFVFLVFFLVFASVLSFLLYSPRGRLQILDILAVTGRVHAKNQYILYKKLQISGWWVLNFVFV